MYLKAVELAKANGWFLARQFETEANAEIHESTTAREIVGDFKGERLDYFVTGYGTGGTVTGRRARAPPRAPRDEDHPERAGERAARRQRPRAGARRRRRPRPSAIRRSSRTRSRAGRRTSSRSCCRRRSTSHYYDQLIPIAGADGIKWAQALAQKEGIFTGISGGSTFGVALQIAETAHAGLGDPVHAARHRRALPDDAALRGHRGGHGRGGARDFALDARAIRCRRTPMKKAPAAARAFRHSIRRGNGPAARSGPGPT